MLADVALAKSSWATADTPPGFAPMHLAIAAFVHDGGRSRDRGRYLQLVRWLEETEERLDPVLSLWQARLLARRGGIARAGPARAPGTRRGPSGRDEMLEAWCEVISEQGAWDEAPMNAAELRAMPSWAGEPPLALYATRLDGRAAAAAAEPERAIELLGSAADGFTALEAEWEAAVTGLELACSSWVEVRTSVLDSSRRRSLACSTGWVP